jgi:predicted aspartyl protease
MVAVQPVLAADAPDAVTSDVLQEILIQAPEPRYVAPTTRDRIGRIWAPVYINEQGPFRLVLDSGASTSCVIEEVAVKLGIPLDASPSVRLMGATGGAVTSAIRVDSLRMGDLLLKGKNLPVIPDALGGAQGILGGDGLLDKRIYIDFRHDLIRINRSHGERAPRGFVTVPVKLVRGRLLMADARVGNVRVKVIIDTGGQTTIANAAMRDALRRQQLKTPPTKDIIVGATGDEEQGDGYPTPPIKLGDIQITMGQVTFSDLFIFKHWDLLNEPTVLLGMDVLGRFDTLIIDYRRSELHIKIRA